MVEWWQNNRFICENRANIAKEIVNIKGTGSISKQILSEYHEDIANHNGREPQIVGRELSLYYSSPRLGRNIFYHCNYNTFL